MAYQYGNQAGPGPSYFRTVIEYSISDVGYAKRISYRFLVQVVTGDFYGTNISKSWGGTVSVSTPGEYGHSQWYSLDVPYGETRSISASSQYTGGSGTHVSSVGYSYTAPRPTYRVAYDANGGSGAPSAQTKTYGYTLALSSTRPIRTGYTFLGWSKNRSASFPSYYPGGSYTENASVTLYAVWRINSYTVTYDAETNGGLVNGDPTYTVTRNHNSKLGDLPVPTRQNYKFIEWNTQKDGRGTKVTEDTVVTGDMYLYAIFELQANCYVRRNGKYVAGMMYQKVDGEYKTGVVSVKVDGEYKGVIM